MKAGSASSYVARNVLPFGTKNAVTNFCVELYLFPERVTYEKCMCTDLGLDKYCQ